MLRAAAGFVMSLGWQHLHSFGTRTDMAVNTLVLVPAAYKIEGFRGLDIY